MAFVNCKVPGCNSFREVKPIGPAYYTLGLCAKHMKFVCEEVEEEIPQPPSKNKLKLYE